MDDDEVAEDDLKWIQDEFKDKAEVLQELKRLEVELFSESLDNYYDNYWK